ncbi:MAG: SUMF1/EgtB/PvdO family nonheme iron enzyme [Acidobacteriota bacterium]|nr:SUMF1/EgtB/PvdO family nonheme iron enzyme [Acidobacteriota bacterium]
MAASQVALKVQPDLLSRMVEARALTDAIFDLLPPNSYYERPIPERHRLIFYLGHLEAFDWNLLSEPLGLKSDDAGFDKLFAFGIDPVDGGLPADMPKDWPTITRVEKYNRNIRQRIDQALLDAAKVDGLNPVLSDGTLLHVAIEHRLMHEETLAYLLHNLAYDKKNAPWRPRPESRPAPTPRQITVPAGIATLGMSAAKPHAFGWDNEFGKQKIRVPEFSVDVFPVTNAEYMKFVIAGGYENPRYWKSEDWEWKQRTGIQYPHFWSPARNGRADDLNAGWQLRGMFGKIPLAMSRPVYVSQAEASAFAAWAGKKLPTEAQWHRAAYGAPEGTERAYPWGDARPDSTRGNFRHRNWDATPVDAHPAGASAFGIFDLLGNGWEWTRSEFAPLPGFEAFSFYPGYSANFFDGKHFVMKGGSARTDVCMLRRTFRNWFQPHYPYIYSKFRCVEE